MKIAIMTDSNSGITQEQGKELEEILKKLDELHKAVEVGKRPYQNILKVIISAGVTAMICFLIGVLMHVFLN